MIARRSQYPIRCVVAKTSSDAYSLIGHTTKSRLEAPGIHQTRCCRGIFPKPKGRLDRGAVRRS
jgi:hypothetical protein